MCTLEEFIEFIKNAPSTFGEDEKIKKLLLPNGEAISCVKWDNEFYISGTDVIRCVTYRFEGLGRTVRNVKKFEEGVFSDLRNLKPGLDASLQEPHSELLRFLHRHQCIRTQKKQKVFFWHSVPHNRMFAEAIEREIKRDALGQECATFVPNLDPFSVPNPHSRSTSQDGFYPFPELSFDMSDFYSSTDQSSSFDSSQCFNTELWDMFMPFYSQPEEDINSQFPNFFSLGLQSMEPSSMTSFDSLPDFFASPTSSFPPVARTKMHHCTYPACTRKFKRREHLRRHILSHSGNRPFICPIVSCQRPFSRKDNLVQHIKTHRF